jgi:hypothetical protein
VPGCGQTVAIGKAHLPVLRRAIEIPQGSVPEIEVLEATTSRFELSLMGLPSRVFPVQAPVEKVPGAREAAEFAFMEEFYLSPGPYPGYMVRIAEIAQMRGHRFAVLEIAPVSYKPDEGTLEVASSIRLRVANPGADAIATQAVIDRYSDPHFEQAASGLLLNYRAPSGDAAALPATGYLIITDPDFSDEMEPLATWKNTIGYQATITSTSDIPGGATTTAIRDYIKDAWENWPVPPAFVLLVGDVADIPNWIGAGTDNPATDLYYSAVSGPDYIPDLGIGRFSVVTSEQATALVEKTVDYEKRLFAEGCWFKNAVFMASTDNYAITEGTHDYVISTYLDPAGFTSDKLYTYTYGATTGQVTGAFNAGRGLGTFSGHGGSTLWADGPQFTQGDVLGLTNLDMYPFVQSYACLTGKYTVDECFGETWIRAIDKAGLAFMGSSVTSYWDEDDVLEKGVFRALFDGDLPWTSVMMFMGKVYLYLHYGGVGATQRYFEMYNIMGDPSVAVWTTNQPPVAVCESHTGDADENCCITVTVSDMEGGSYDPDAVEDIANLCITSVDGDPVACGPEAQVCEVGTHTVTLMATDRCGATGTCDATVQVRDVTPPEISVTLNRYVLWPPNHKMADIYATVEVEDNCDPYPTWVLTSVTSNEPDNDGGDGDTDDDIQGESIGTADDHFQLRSERSGNRPGRIYTIGYTARDATGNTANATVYVHVPHDQGGVALCSMGFNEGGNGLDRSRNEFVLVILSRSEVYGTAVSGETVLIETIFDATQLDFTRTYVGNVAGAVLPTRWEELDQNGDGLTDLAVYFTVADVEPLVESIVQAQAGEIWVADPIDPVGLHFESASGVDYLVYDIFQLGPPVVLAGGSGSSAGVFDDRDATEIPDATVLFPAQPNPSTGSTTLRFALAREEHVTLRIYDARGLLIKEVEDRALPAGMHQVIWNGRDLRGQRVAAGVYFVRFSAGAARTAEKLMLVR